jgi:hypothetical protein
MNDKDSVPIVSTIVIQYNNVQQIEDCIVPSLLGLFLLYFQPSVVCPREMGKTQQCRDFYRMVLLALGGMC